ncbi:uncharacterized protein DUF1992 [Aliiruegeria haliotis]|uniref:Uncharacterized protein DUF1992 n=1 Tax=Aliiruegeria haliotis TaxID=1280846 RepID=A0A2T0RUV0_9RHOB|nr:DUF1992 domain-containing protein [Aliiruegeria haliotis]PRY24927.1 uncharacterized protein DUF1992 [Aliiruegeria haliotis]
MVTRWDKISEQRMRKAEAEGHLKGLSGEGKPLPHRPEAALIDSGTAVGHRIMAEAGALPREIELKKQIAALHERLALETDPAARRALMAEVSTLQTRHAMEAEARRKFMGM